jgi:hypothetical protein
MASSEQERKMDEQANSQNECEYCGEPGTSANPIEETVISPPVDGYRFETMNAHRQCASSAAMDMVR